MNDHDFLVWIYNRLIKVHGEEELMDYMGKLRSIINAYPSKKLTPNTGEPLEIHEPS